MHSLKRTVYPLIVPVALIVFSSVTVIKWADLLQDINAVKQLRAAVVIMPAMPYVVLSIGFIMGWRYNNSGMILGTFVLALSYFALDFFNAAGLPLKAVRNQSVTYALALLLPLNLAACSVLSRRRIFTSIGISAMVALIVQALAVIVFCHPLSSFSSQVMSKIKSLSPVAAATLNGFSLRLGTVLTDHSIFDFESISTLPIFAFALAIVFVMIQFVRSNDIRIGGFFLSILAALLGITTKPPEPAAIFYFTAAGLILLITAVEASFVMAYIDELTGLPGRRSLNEALLNVGKKYAIAMIDVDHFKKFNDAYGHKTGDQVLKMIAGGLGRLSGGAKTFRYGGEEFTAIFSGKSVQDVVAHVEAFRQEIESHPFIIRGRERRRRNAAHRSKVRTFSGKKVSVTVSIGLASPGKDLTHPEAVIKAADKNLYKAKQRGRNRVVC